MPYSKPISKQQLLLPERKNFIRLSSICQKNILERLSVDNLIRYIYYIISGDPYIDGDENNRISSGNDFRFTPEGHYLVEQIADDHHHHHSQFIGGGGGHKRFASSPSSMGFYPFNDGSSNRINDDDSYVLDWIAKHAQPQQQQQLPMPSMVMMMTENDRSLINNDGSFSFWKNLENSSRNNGLNNNNNNQLNILYPAFSTNNNNNINNRPDQMEVINLDPSPHSSSSSASTSSTLSTSNSQQQKQKAFPLMEPSTSSSQQKIPWYYQMENQQQHQMINLEQKDTQLFNAFRLPLPSVFNRMPIENRNHLLSTLPSQVKNKYEFYCWSSTTTNPFINGGGDGGNGIIHSSMAN
ncbi:hypothetical protein DERF_010813 [Dermatophagoides farinae]|uniref:Uncharacterized protein n=1 Tax=Dermatophagoides farinae TaxID=6954 RepID=A0A922L2I4_DERFA|nr:hypothetical protein DERF_010813 [Dermatophagoides farinae]